MTTIFAALEYLKALFLSPKLRRQLAESSFQKMGMTRSQARKLKRNIK